MLSNDDITLLCNEKKKEISLWASVFCHRNPNQKIIRNVKPTKVTITCIKDLSNTSFYEIDKSIEIFDESLTKINFCGVCSGSEDTLKLFYTEKECIEYYNNAIFEDIQIIEEYKIKFEKKINDTIKKLKYSFVKSDYMIEKLRR